MGNQNVPKGLPEGTKGVSRMYQRGTEDPGGTMS
jgi:hypothetical protein